jgi:cysteine desulfurase
MNSQINRPIYLDYQATTPLDPRVFEAMKLFFIEEFGNASSSTHLYGWNAEKAVEKARRQIAELINSESKEIIFTSGATESNNLALIGLALSHKEKGNHIITTRVEHKSVLDTLKFLETQGFEITILPVDSKGKVSTQDVISALTNKTILLSVILANNEIGTINSVNEIGLIAKNHGVIFHVDAAQALGKIPIDVKTISADLISFSAHKVYGPKGVGALFIRKQTPRLRLTPLIHGGGHELGLRSGTLNVPGIVGFGEACALAQKELLAEAKRVGLLRDAFQKELEKALPDIKINGDLENRLPHNLSLSFKGVDSSSLIRSLKEVAVSPGSACATASLAPSHVLTAIGLPDDLAQSTIRFGFGRFTTSEEASKAAQLVIKAVKTLKGSTPLYESLEK